MDSFVIEGGKPLLGEVNIAGAKNAVLPILAASLLAVSPMELHNVPHLQDVHTMFTLLRSMGAVIRRETSNTFAFVDASYITHCEVDYLLASKIRASIVLLGPLLARFGKARVALPGGDAIGARPVDLHLKALARLGATISIQGNYIEANVEGRLQGTTIEFEHVTVTGTENILMAATLAKGTTVIRRAALEPEVTDLARCLNCMGARITGIGTETLVIEGVETLQGVSYTVIPDRIEAGTYLMGALMTQGLVKVQGIHAHLLEAVLQKMLDAGAHIKTGSSFIEVDMRGKRPRAVDVTTQPYPHFPTDMQAQIMAMNCIAKGNACITETIFENRFMHAIELMKMGADISFEGLRAYVRGVPSLAGAQVCATDLRASASLVLAACAAEGKTIIQSIDHIDRGYEHIEKKLQGLGAHISRVVQMAAVDSCAVTYGIM